MATASDTHSSERTLSDHEFEELLQKTWEIVQNQRNQRKNHQLPLDPSAESPSWT